MYNKYKYIYQQPQKKKITKGHSRSRKESIASHYIACQWIPFSFPISIAFQSIPIAKQADLGGILKRTIDENVKEILVGFNLDMESRAQHL